MKVFKRREPSNPNPSTASYSVLDAQCTVRGDLTTDGTLRIDGRLDGSILRAAMVLIGAGATITGNVSCTEIVVGGTINGNLVAQLRVEMEATGVVNGDVEADTILVHEGAVLRGHMVV